MQLTSSRVLFNWYL